MEFNGLNCYCLNSLDKFGSFNIALELGAHMETPVKITVSLVAFRAMRCWSLRILISFTPKIGANFFSDTIESFIVKASVLPYYNRLTQSKKFVTADPALAWQMSCFH